MPDEKGCHELNRLSGALIPLEPLWSVTEDGRFNRAAGLACNAAGKVIAGNGQTLRQKALLTWADVVLHRTLLGEVPRRQRLGSQRGGVGNRADQPTADLHLGAGRLALPVFSEAEDQVAVAQLRQGRTCQ
jgi:hypothetical protein